MQQLWLHIYPPCHDASHELDMNVKFTIRGVPCQTKQTGQAMVEFMLVTVFVFILMVSILQMILLMHAYNTLADAAKEGIRYQIVHGTGNSNCSGPSKIGTSNSNCSDTTGTKVQTVVTNFAALSFQTIPSSKVTVDYNPNSANPGGACNKAGCLVRVTVSYTYQPFFGLGWPKFPLYAAADGRIMN